MHQVMQASQQKPMAMKMTGHPDHDFAMMMRAHHEAGIAMAQIQAESGKDKEMIQMAKKIIDAQKREIKKFDAWSAKHPVR